MDWNNWGWQQWVMFLFICIRVIRHLVKDGEYIRIEGQHPRYDFKAAVIYFAFMMWLLTTGGFFK